jgi:hypothetical protein
VPIISTEAQLKKIVLLNTFIKECYSYGTTERKGRTTTSEIIHKCDYYEFVLDCPATLGIDGVVKLGEINPLTVHEGAMQARPIIESEGTR